MPDLDDSNIYLIAVKQSHNILKNVEERRGLDNIAKKKAFHDMEGYKIKKTNIFNRLL